MDETTISEENSASILLILLITVFQTAIKFPRLIRTSVSLGGGDENMLNSAPYKFSIVQHTISDFMKSDLRIINCDDLSTEMMSLLGSLLKFGFYNSVGQLQDIISPLMQALDEYRVSGSKFGRKLDDSNSLKDSDSVINTRILKAESVKGLSVSTRLKPATGSQKVVKRHQHGRVSNQDDDDEDNDDAHKSSSMSYLKILPNMWRYLFKSKKNVESSNGDNIDPVGTAKRRSSISSSEGEPVRRSSINIIPQPKSVNHSTAHRLLDIMQSTGVLIFILILVLATTAVAIISVISPSLISENFEKQYGYFDLCVSLVFMIDLNLRLTLYVIIYRAFSSFWKDYFNIIDLLIVSLDVVILSIGGHGTHTYFFANSFK